MKSEQETTQFENEIEKKRIKERIKDGVDRSRSTCR